MFFFTKELQKHVHCHLLWIKKRLTSFSLNLLCDFMTHNFGLLLATIYNGILLKTFKTDVQKYNYLKYALLAMRVKSLTCNFVVSGRVDLSCYKVWSSVRLIKDTTGILSCSFVPKELQKHVHCHLLWITIEMSDFDQFFSECFYVILWHTILAFFYSLLVHI